MARKYSSTAVETTLSGSISSVATSITVGSVTGWPTSPSVSASYTIIIDPDTVDEEVCEVTGASGTVLTIVRGVDGSTAKSHNIGAVVKHGVSARDFADSQNHIDDLSAHAATGGVVGATKIQTLTNKTISASANTITDITNTSVAAGAAIAASKIAGTAITAADTGTVTSLMIADGTIVNADISASAAVAWSKINSTGATLDATSTIGGVSGTSLAADRTAWTSYTPTFSNVTGTPVVDFAYKLIGKTLYLRGCFGTGIISAATASFTLPASLKAAGTLYQNLSSSDTAWRDWSVRVGGGQSAVTFQNSTSSYGISLAGFAITGVIEVQ